MFGQRKADIYDLEDSQAEEAAMRRNRIKSQESEIASLKKQLAGQRQDSFGGRTGGKTAHGVPSEYLCPITQVHLAFVSARLPFNLSSCNPICCDRAVNHFRHRRAASSHFVCRFVFVLH